MKVKYISFIILLIVINGCTSLSLNSGKSQKFPLKKDINRYSLKEWYLKSPTKDTFPGIGFLRVEQEKKLNPQNSNEVIVAVIDMEIDIDHEDLKNNIWTNDKEIPNNNIDDDNNGYIDDIHGWNFLGNINGQNIIFANYEYTRVLKKYRHKFKQVDTLLLNSDEKGDYIRYINAKNKFENQLIFAKKDKKRWNFYADAISKQDSIINKYFPSKKFTAKKIDSISKLIEKKSKTHKYLDFLKLRLRTKISDEEILFQKLNADERITKMLNLNYNEREILSETSINDINDKSYGSPILNANKSILSHGTAVASVLLPKKSKILNNIKLMPLCISPYGDEHDKDIALAIRYAVDNGAKIINMSSGKYFSINDSIVKEALKYAEKNNVLFITSAGNLRLNLDNNNNYPNDNFNGQEILKNFLKVGGNGYRFNEKLIYSRSNYGKEEVDIIAPAYKINVIRADKKGIRQRMQGTSFSTPLTSLTAALILSYYPNLTAQEVKHIIMKSGISIDVMVYKPSASKEKELVPFSSLSKSGKIVNAYNALLMAKEVSKKKKRN